MRVNDVVGVAGFVQPGMHVDVLVSGRVPGSDDSATRTILQNILVLSAGQVLQPEPKGQAINATVVTLQVKPDEAELLTLASGEGRVQLVLRNSSDTQPEVTPGKRLSEMYKTGQPEPVRHPRRSSTQHVQVVKNTPAPAPVRETVEVIRCTQKSVTVLEDGSASVQRQGELR